jgi:hypothetical protein
VKSWAGYVDQLNKALKRPPLGVITEVSLVKDEETQFKMRFKLVEAITDGDVLAALMARADQIESTLMNPYPEPVDEAPPPPRRGAAPKFASKAPVAAKEVVAVNAALQKRKGAK